MAFRPVQLATKKPPKWSKLEGAKGSNPGGLYADANGVADEEVEWKPCLDDDMLDMLEEKGMKQIKTELDICELDEDELDFKDDDDDF